MRERKGKGLNAERSARRAARAAALERPRSPQLSGRAAARREAGERAALTLGQSARAPHRAHRVGAERELRRFDRRELSSPHTPACTEFCVALRAISSAASVARVVCILAWSHSGHVPNRNVASCRMRHTTATAQALRAQRIRLHVERVLSCVGASTRGTTCHRGTRTTAHHQQPAARHRARAPPGCIRVRCCGASPHLCHGRGGRRRRNSRSRERASAFHRSAPASARRTRAATGHTSTARGVRAPAGAWLEAPMRACCGDSAGSPAVERLRARQKDTRAARPKPDGRKSTVSAKCVDGRKKSVRIERGYC